MEPFIFALEAEDGKELETRKMSKFFVMTSASKSRMVYYYPCSKYYLWNQMPNKFEAQQIVGTAGAG